jgi:aspartate/methionine/tyrosine aminotransferase
MPQTRSKRTPDGMGVFLTMDDAKTAAHSAGRDVVDLSVGTSDLAPPPEALAELEASVRDPSTHSYCLKRATMPLLCAAVDWFASTYPDAAQRLDPSCNALSLLGSQEGLAHLLMAVADEGDGIILPDVAYPSYWGAVRVAGLLPTFIPLDSSTLLPDLDALSPSAATGCKLLLLNLPNNPTGAVADVDYWRGVLAFAERHDLLLIHDNPYVGQVYSEQPPPSPLALPGGLERTVELFRCACWLPLEESAMQRGGKIRDLEAQGVA